MTELIPITLIHDMHAVPLPSHRAIHKEARWHAAMLHPSWSHCVQSLVPCLKRAIVAHDDEAIVGPSDPQSVRVPLYQTTLNNAFVFVERAIAN